MFIWGRRGINFSVEKVCFLRLPAYLVLGHQLSSRILKAMDKPVHWWLSRRAAGDVQHFCNTFCGCERPQIFTALIVETNARGWVLQDSPRFTWAKEMEGKSASEMELQSFVELCRVPNTSYHPNESDCEMLTLLGMTGVNQGFWWCSAETHTCWQLWIRFTSSPKLASSQFNKAVLLCNSFFMSAANSSYCWPKILSQSPGNFYWITLIILIKMCRGERAFTGFRVKVSFERTNRIILWHLKYHCATLQLAHPWVSLKLPLH